MHQIRIVPLVMKLIDRTICTVVEAKSTRGCNCHRFSLRWRRSCGCELGAGFGGGRESESVDSVGEKKRVEKENETHCRGCWRIECGKVEVGGGGFMYSAR